MGRAVATSRNPHRRYSWDRPEGKAFVATDVAGEAPPHPDGRRRAADRPASRAAWSGWPGSPTAVALDGLPPPRPWNRGRTASRSCRASTVGLLEPMNRVPRPSVSPASTATRSGARVRIRESSMRPARSRSTRAATTVTPPSSERVVPSANSLAAVAARSCFAWALAACRASSSWPRSRSTPSRSPSGGTPSRFAASATASRRLDDVQGPLARGVGETDDPVLDPLGAEDRHHPHFAGMGTVGATARLHVEYGDLDDAELLPRHGAALVEREPEPTLRLGPDLEVALDRTVLPDHLVHPVLHGPDLLRRQGLEVGDVDAGRLGPLVRPGLPDVGAEHLPEGPVEEVGSRVVLHQLRPSGPVDLAPDPLPPVERGGAVELVKDPAY